VELITGADGDPERRVMSRESDWNRRWAELANGVDCLHQDVSSNLLLSGPLRARGFSIPIRGPRSHAEVFRFPGAGSSAHTTRYDRGPAATVWEFQEFRWAPSSPVLTTPATQGMPSNIRSSARRIPVIIASGCDESIMVAAMGRRHTTDIITRGTFPGSGAI
jgi:hypothetical protein